jgi:hypothetical protein
MSGSLFAIYDPDRPSRAGLWFPPKRPVDYPPGAPQRHSVRRHFVDKNGLVIAPTKNAGLYIMEYDGG